MNACDLQGGHFARPGETCACGEVGFGVDPRGARDILSDATRAPRVEREEEATP